MIKIIVDTFLIFSDGTRQRQEFAFDVTGQLGPNSLVNYIKDNTPHCINVIILDVWHQVEKI